MRSVIVQDPWTAGKPRQHWVDTYVPDRWHTFCLADHRSDAPIGSWMSYSAYEPGICTQVS